ncbi:MAG: uL30 family ribosomal protein [Candidatus Micrarchaeales archaeon]|nr:uL30 family ribosomal protein [Candidatus Micrarchaeales archaeon]
MIKQVELKGKVVAAVRVRGRVNVRTSIEETMKRLNLKAPNNCTIIMVNDQYLGMLKKCANHIAYGEIDEPTLAKLVKKYALEIDPNAALAGKADISTLKEEMPLRLHPPKHGYDPIKKHFSQGGSLGYMGKDINKLITRMV